MLRGGLIFTFYILFVYGVFAGDVKRVKRAFEKANYEKAEGLILKSLVDHQINPGIKYYYSLLFLTAEFERFSIDSATIFIRQSIVDYKSASKKVIEEMVEEGISMESLNDHLERITELAFEKAKSESTVSSWETFILTYPNGQQKGKAIDSRDSLAFQAVNKQAVASLQSYLDNYPNSKLRVETRNILDRLLVNEFWRTKSKDDLIAFVKDNPRSVYRETAIRHLLKLSTISGESDDFLTFIQDYPKAIATTQAVNFLYHLDKEQEFQRFDQYFSFHPQADSLLKIHQTQSEFWFVTYESSYNLVSHQSEFISTPLTSINGNAACSGLLSLVSGSDIDGAIILTKDGKTIIRGELIRDLGVGFLLVRQGSKKHIYHKSGARIIEDIQEAKILNNQFLKVKRHKWALYSLTGISLTEHRFDNIFVDGSFWFFELDNLLALTTPNKITSSFPDGLALEFKFEDYELFEDQLLIGFQGKKECLLKQSGQFLVPWGTHHIYPHHSNGYIHDRKGYAFYGSERSKYYPYVEVNEGFILYKEDKKQWMLFSNFGDWSLPLKDSVKLISKHCSLITGKNTRLIFHNQGILEIDSSSVPQSLSSKMPFTLIKADISKVVDENGNIIFSGDYDKIELLNDTLFSISSNEKYGVISTSGQRLLPIQFDYLSLTDGIISFISDQKIGAYDLHHRTYFEPFFESIIEAFGYSYKTKKGDLTGLINSEGEDVLPFIYEEISEWTDSLVWAKTTDMYRLVNIYNQEVEMEATLLNSFQAGTETFMKFYGSDGFGLIKESCLLLKPIYSDIVWIGDESHGVIMADQTLPDAGFHVVTYFDSKGVKIHSQAYSNEDFEKVLCDR